MKASHASTRFIDLESPLRYVGYVDILGFSRLVETDFERAKAAYDTILGQNSLLPTNDQWQTRPGNVDIAAASDSFLVVGDQLPDVVNWCSGIFVTAIREHLLVRGSIAYGRHVQQNVSGEGPSRHHMLSVSEALVWAAADEKRQVPPCGVTLHRSVPAQAVEELDNQPLLAKQRAILFKDGRWITNPFGVFELHWIQPRLKEMLDAHRGTKHEAKYQWIMELFADVQSNQPLKPIAEGSAAR